MSTTLDTPFTLSEQHDNQTRNQLRIRGSSKIINIQETTSWTNIFDYYERNTR